MIFYKLGQSKLQKDSNYEIKNILDKEGEINRATISIDGTPVPVEDILGEYSNKKISNHVLAEYWKNWVDNSEMEKSLK